MCSPTQTKGRWYPVERVNQLMRFWDSGLDKRQLARLKNDDLAAFISYARADGEPFAKGLRQWLGCEAPEITLWRDREEMVGGIGWWKQIEEAMRSVQYLVMVMTPGALDSETTRKEWRLARKEGVSVLPLLVAEHPINFNELPQWMSKKHFYDLTIMEQRERFATDLHSSQRIDRVPFMAPDLPDGFVERPCEFDALLSQVLTTDGEDPVAITTALHGVGGFGKTTLATAICHDDCVISAFDDGILWVTFGEQPDLRGALVKLYAALTDKRPDFKDAEDGATVIADCLAEKSCLLVIDDVWEPAHLKPFVRGGPKCTRLAL